MTRYQFTIRVMGLPKPSVDGVGGSHVVINEDNFLEECGAFNNVNEEALGEGGFFPMDDAEVHQIGKWDFLVSGVYQTERGFRDILDVEQAIEGDFSGGWAQAFTPINLPQKVIVTQVEKMENDMSREASVRRVANRKIIQDQARRVEQALTLLGDVNLVLTERGPGHGEGSESLADVYGGASKALREIGSSIPSLELAHKLLRRIR